MTYNFRNIVKLLTFFVYWSALATAPAETSAQAIGQPLLSPKSPPSPSPHTNQK